MPLLYAWRLCFCCCSAKLIKTEALLAIAEEALEEDAIFLVLLRIEKDFIYKGVHIASYLVILSQAILLW